MEKLIELLNEYEENRPMELPRQYRRKEMPTFKWWLVAISEYDDEMEDNSDLLAISKFNWFIKWLVDNDKIDFYTILKENWTFRKEFYAIENKKEYERLIMLLAIQDSPLELLISILK